jgi:DNA-binding beta-propeller fold protein YncE
VRFLGFIDLPAHRAPGGFDHAAVHAQAARLYVAHTSNDALDVIDSDQDRFLHSIPNLRGVAGALVSEEAGMVFTSNRGEDTVGIFRAGEPANVTRVRVGVRPNGLAFDAARGLLLAANVGDPARPGSHTVSIVDIERHEMVHSIPVAGRTRWAIFDAGSGCFYVNIAEPAQIAIVESARPTVVKRAIEVPGRGPHGLDYDPVANRLFCACDDGKLLMLDAVSGKIRLEAGLAGAPDVIFFNQARKHVYAAVGEPGVLQVLQADTLESLEEIPTEKGAHTIGYDSARNKVYVFLPQTHRAAVYMDA